MQDLSAAIARQEGANPAYNNPGNLRSGPGQVGTSPGGFAIFPDYATGEAALENQVQLNINRGLTLSEFFGGKPGVYAGYAPAADSNQPNVYTTNVSAWTNLPADVPLNQLGSGASSSDSGGTVDFSMLGDSLASIDPSMWIWAGAALLGAVVLASVIDR